VKHKDTITENRRQAVIAAVPGGKWIIYRYGLVFRVFMDCPEGLVEFDQTWIARHRSQLHQICLAASAQIHNHGLDVDEYAGR
jgi:hypothetical protein